MRTVLKINRATPQMRAFAKRLIVHDAGGKSSAGRHAPAGFPTCEKLRLHLATFMGQTGVHTLLARSLALAVAEVPWLRAVRTGADDPLEGVAQLQAQLDPDEFLEGQVVLLAQLLGLLAALIGDSLTLRLVREIWPKVPLKVLDFGNGGET